jgi:hypothetical protein
MSGERRMKTEKFRLVFSGDTDGIKNTHAESVVFNGEVAEKPARRELGGVPLDTTIGKIWDSCFNAVSEIEGL